MCTTNNSIINYKIDFPEYIDLFKNYDKLSNIFACGGCIRDYILSGKFNNDIDIFIPCSSSELTDLLNYLSLYGKIDLGQYGSPRFYPNEICGKYVDIVPFYNFIVAEKEITDIRSLLKNFDFSANSIAYNLKTNELLNPNQGLEDISNKVLRALRTDFPEKSLPSPINLSTNSVFWFRLLHYQKNLGFTFDSNTRKWVIENAWRYKDLRQFKKYFFEPNISEEMKKQLDI